MDNPPIEPSTLEPWLKERLDNIFQHPRTLRFEALLYGPLNKYIGTHFPRKCRFMTKPQAVLHPAIHAVSSHDVVDHDELDDTSSKDWAQLEESWPTSPAPVDEDEEDEDEEDENMDYEGDKEDKEDKEDKDYEGDKEDEEAEEAEDSSLGDTSMDTADSYAQHTQRGVKGIRFPDFLTVNPIGALDGNHIVLIIEVKKCEPGKKTALFQLTCYLGLAIKKNSVRPLIGILIWGWISTIIEYDGKENPE
ncbi:hypothetical protein OG21DRAFT_1490565 [Imleria badia]|nr:hypothetical protein OG21DRAFT_1490565 [Imleria badia]